MHGYFPFDIVLPETPRRRLLVLFCSVMHPAAEELAECLERYCDDKTPPDEILVIGPHSDSDELRGAVESEKFRNRVPPVTRYRNTPNVKCVFFDGTGLLSDESFDLVRRMGMTYIFGDRGGLLSAPATHHYVRTSRPTPQHSRQFLRVANVLVDGAEIDFIAFCCLPHVPVDLKHIYCDTGAISSIALAINALRRRINPALAPATVSSFGSYARAKHFQFRDMDRSLILISGTTSQNLADWLCQRDANIPRDRILTVFYLSDFPRKGNVVCDLAKDSRYNPNGFQPIQSFSEQDCPFCAKGSIQIQISGDHFLPGEGRVEAITLAVPHVPKWLRDFLRQVVGTGLVRANYRVQSTMHATKEVFFDLEGTFYDADMLGLSRFKRRFDWVVDQAVPVGLNRIIRLDDPASAIMARHIAERIKPKLGEVSILLQSDIAKDMGAFPFCARGFGSFLGV